MEAPLPPPASPLTTGAPPTTPSLTAPSTVPPHAAAAYPDSVDSSPRSRTTDGWDDPSAPAASSAPPPKLRLMCSYGGHIVPRPHDKSLCYVGGDTRIVVVDRNTSLSSLASRLSNTLLDGRAFTLKYQLPTEDLDSLISVTSDEDLDNMIEEYDRTIASNSNKPSRLRLFLFPVKPESSQSMGQILEGTAKSGDWFLDALNGAGLLNRGFSDSTSVNCLLGLDDDVGNGVNVSGNAGNNLDLGARDGEGSLKNAKQQNQNHNNQQQGGQDVHSVPDSPMLDTSSSFGSTSSSPSLVNLPPIRVHVEDGGGGVRVQDQKVGIEEQFAQINVGGGMQKPPQQRQQEEGLFAISSPPPMPTTISVPGLPVTTAPVSGEFVGRVFSDDERSDHGVPVGFRKPPILQSQPQNLPPQAQPKSNGGPDLPSPDSVSSDSSMNNPLSRQKPVIYQDQVVHIPSVTNMVANNLVDTKINPSDPNNRVQIQESSYVLQPQFEQQRTQQRTQQQTETQPQFVHAPPHFVHHHPSGGAMAISAYYQVYPSQQQPLRHHPQLDQQFPVYYVAAPAPGRQAQPYNVSMQQSGSISEAPNTVPSSRAQAPPNPTMLAPVQAAYAPVRNAPMGQPEAGSGGVYRTAQAPGSPHLVQVPTTQQFMGYSQIHQPGQPVVAPASVGNPNFRYDFADPAQAQMYFTQPLSHAHAQYLTMTPGATMVLPEGSAGQIAAENMKQPIRSSQPL